MAKQREKTKREAEEPQDAGARVEDSGQPNGDGAGAAKASEDELPVEVGELRDRLQRCVAELQNYRKQTEKRQRDLRKFMAKDFFLQILPIVDNFGAALKAAEQGQDPDSVLIGVRMIHEMLLKLLADNQVEPIPAGGLVFDPEFHEAVMREESSDVEPGHVINEVQRGYRMGDLVIRHARVVVAAPAEESDEADTAPPQDSAPEEEES